MKKQTTTELTSRGFYNGGAKPVSVRVRVGCEGYQAEVNITQDAADIDFLGCRRLQGDDIDAMIAVLQAAKKLLKQSVEQVDKSLGGAE